MTPSQHLVERAAKPTFSNTCGIGLMLFELPHLIDALPGSAWTALPDGRVEFLNRRWLDYTGLTAEQAADLGWIEAIHPDDRERVGDYWRSCVISGISADTEARMRRHDGAYRWFRFRASPVGESSAATSRSLGAYRHAPIAERWA